MADPTFPRLRWRVEIQGMNPMDFDGINIRPKQYGIFFTHPAISADVPSRISFFPWHKILRAYQIGDTERGNKDTVNREGE